MKEYLQTAIDDVCGKEDFTALKNAPLTVGDNGNEWTTRFVPLIPEGVWTKIGFKKDGNELNIDQFYPLTPGDAAFQVPQSQRTSVESSSNWGSKQVEVVMLTGTQMNTIKAALTKS